MQVTLCWVEASSGKETAPVLTVPVAFGRDFNAMPAQIENRKVSRMVLDAEQVAPFHALLMEREGRLVVLSQGEAKGIAVNGLFGSAHVLSIGDRLSISPFEIVVQAIDGKAPVDKEPASVQDRKATPARAETSIAGNVASITLDNRQEKSAAAAFGADGTCQRQVGFLFKRRCGRTSTKGCRDCQNGRLNSERDLYAEEYAWYESFGDYSVGNWGDAYYYDRDRYSYDPATRNVDFNESDAASFEEEGDHDYEMELDAS